MSSEKHPITGMTMDEIADLNADLLAENAALRQQLAFASDAAEKGAKGRELGTAFEECQKAFTEALKLLEDIKSDDRFLSVETARKIQTFLAALKEGK